MIHPNTATPRPWAHAPAPSPRDRNWPFEPRELTRKEQRKDDLYLFTSPKLGRTVAVIGALALAQALELDFVTGTAGYVERPRRLEYGEGELELTFWRRERTGREQFLLLVPNASRELENESRRRRHRHSRAIIDAANAAGISLEFVFEDDVVAKAASIGTWFRLLPYVQTGLALPHRASIRDRLLEAFDAQARMTVMQVEAALTGLHAADVRAVMCSLIHSGELVIDPTRPLSRYTVVDLGEQA